MASILKSTLNTRFLPTGNMKKYVRSDYPGKLTDDEVDWLQKNSLSIFQDKLMDMPELNKPKKFLGRWR